MTVRSEPVMLSPSHTSTVPRHDAIVAALRRPDVYPDGASSVEVIETHRAWVFLTEAHAYKLAKTNAAHRHDAASLPVRLRACQQELALNQRLGGDVYQDVVPLVRVQQGYRVGAQGPAVEWLIAMRRLPRALMLDVAIAQRNVHPDQVDTLAALLQSFYTRASPAATTGAEYRQRLLADMEAKGAALACPNMASSPRTQRGSLARCTTGSRGTRRSWRAEPASSSTRTETCAPSTSASNRDR